MKLLACYGGSFDPVHDGHLAVARAVRDALDAEVALFPAADPPHKSRTHADAGTRADLLELAVADERGLRVDRRELRRAGPSYTVDTLRELRGECGPGRPIAWIVGGDSLLQLDSWHQWRALFDSAHVLAVERPGARLDPAAIERQAPLVAAEIGPRRVDPATLQGSPAGGYAMLALPGLRPESSTEVRRRIAAGEPWQAMVPAAVAAEIEGRGLYRDGPDTAPPL